MTNPYAGIGSRETPLAIVREMENIAMRLALAGWTLRSGAGKRPVKPAPDTDSADLAFERGCDAVRGAKVIRCATLYQPWLDHAAQYHPAWDKCSEWAQGAHARNSAILLGDYLNDPARFVVCWTKGGAVTGGTGQGLRIADAYKIPVFNLFWPEHLTALWSWINGR